MTSEAEMLQTAQADWVKIIAPNPVHKEIVRAVDEMKTYLITQYDDGSTTKEEIDEKRLAAISPRSWRF